MQQIAYYWITTLSLKHAILVMLEQEPSSGYDLLRHFRGSLGYFWNAKHQQIYRQLKQLCDEQLVSFENTSQSHKPDKKVYNISEKGREELLRWLSEPVSPNKINDALLVKIYGAELGDSKHVESELKRHIEIHEKRLDELKAIEHQYKSLSDDKQVANRYPYLTLRRGIIGEEAWLQWADEAIQLFKK